MIFKQKNMTIEEQHDYLTTWAKEKGIMLISAEVKTNKAPLITFNANETNSINDFTNLVSSSGGKAVFYESLLFTEDDYSEYLGYVSKLEDEEMKSDFTKLEPYKNKILKFSFHFIHYGSIYVFENSSQEAEIFHDIQATLIDIIHNAQANELPEDKANEIGRQLAEHEQFSRVKNRSQRDFLAKKLFPELADYDGNAFYTVTQIAESIYEIEIKPRKEQQLVQNIQQLKKEGKTKVVICQELQISKDTLNKYY
jgi:hypothetical protein